ncbi:MAG: lycopene cyclase domain-containing protein [Saprospiraceae bacterium]|nr:lycopene cyclase domain-containing protein [Saprospiraceae bacterium]
MKGYTYLIIDLACIALPLIFSFYKERAFYKEWKYFLPVNFIVAILFLLWDSWFTSNGVWGFNEEYLTGIYLGNLPLEEVLFFICIPYACTFTYFALDWLLKEKPFQFAHNFFSGFLWIISVIAIILFHDKSYTFYTALFLFIVVTLTIAVRKDISFLLLSYAVILPFFFLSNGILTGSFLESPIVWYNNQENLGIRMFTIPLEDTFYGLLLVMCNILGYQLLKNIYQKKTLKS